MAQAKVTPTRKPRAKASPQTRKPAKARSKTKGKVAQKPWLKIGGWLFLFFLLFGSMLAVFVTIFFSVPNARAAENPQVSIIIDDMGYDMVLGRQLIELPYELSFSFLPFAPHQKNLAERAYLAEKDILVHLPLEPQAKNISLEEKTLLASQSIVEQRMLFLENVDRVPHAQGLNNHMGSAFTRDGSSMNSLLSWTMEQQLFFVDSYTTAESVASEEAGKLGVSIVQRDVFLDNVQDEGAICSQINQLLMKAQKKGRAIAIAHPHRATYKALKICLPILASRVDIVPISNIFEGQGERLSRYPKMSLNYSRKEL